VISECELGLLNPEGSGALQLLCDRGLTYYTIRSHNLGYNPRHQTQHGLYVREGITIPWTENGSVRGIKVRQPNKEPKYVWVGGSRRAGLFLGSEIQAGLPTLVVEGEFDALLGSQSIRDLVNVVTLGSASESPDQLACQQLLTSPLTLVCYDNDPAGKSGSLRWTSLSGRVRFTNLPYGKDLTDFWRAGGDLRAWITGVLKEITTDPTRHPTVAVSGINDNQVGVG
jgi:DNA primase